MSLELTPEILRKYDVAGPRYTSYPTAPEWSSEVSHEDYQLHLGKISDEDVSLYFHIPFCQSLCTYCGCNVAIRKHWPKYGDEYIDYLEKEMIAVTENLKKKLTVQQLHWGGGTPTFLNLEQISRLFQLIEKYFNINFEGELSIEIEPRTVDRDQLQLLRNLGFNRISMGVQDFDEKVQNAINRVHDFEKVKEIKEICDDLKFNSINLDLIYGLPFQTLEGYKETVKKVLLLKPDRVALYSFAHLPWLKSHHKKISEESLPNADEKLSIFLMASEAFSSGDYQRIAMDHFALNTDEMSIAFREGRLNRNFMGYTVLPTENIIGFGASSIGYVEGGYFQNEKSLINYYKGVNDTSFGIEKGLNLDEDDLIRRELISELMCHFELNRHRFSEKFNIEFDDFFDFEKEHLEKCVREGLCEDDGQNIKVTELGKLFVRNIAMGFDAYLREKGQHRRFSKVI